jgi:hypothetical protein
MAHLVRRDAGCTSWAGFLASLPGDGLLAGTAKSPTLAIFRRHARPAGETARREHQIQRGPYRAVDYNPTSTKPWPESTHGKRQNIKTLKRQNFKAPQQLRRVSYWWRKWSG